MAQAVASHGAQARPGRCQSVLWVPSSPCAFRTQPRGGAVALPTGDSVTVQPPAMDGTPSTRRLAFGFQVQTTKKPGGREGALGSRRPQTTLSVRGRLSFELGVPPSLAYPLLIRSLKGRCDHEQGLMSCRGRKKPVKEDGRPHWTSV